MGKALISQLNSFFSLVRSMSRPIEELNIMPFFGFGGGRTWVGVIGWVRRIGCLGEVGCLGRVGCLTWLLLIDKFVKRSFHGHQTCKTTIRVLEQSLHIFGGVSAQVKKVFIGFLDVLVYGVSGILDIR